MVYGLGSRSYNKSRENRENKKAVAEATAAYEKSEKVGFVVPWICNCRSFRFPHAVADHRKLKSDHDWLEWEKRNDSVMWDDRLR